MMLKINYKQIYVTNEKNNEEWVLIIYDISANHYVGMPVYSKEKDGCLFCKSINKTPFVMALLCLKKSRVTVENILHEL